MAAFLSPVPLHTFSCFGSHLSSSRHASPLRPTVSYGPRMAMRGDSTAPLITVQNTGSDQTSTVGLSMRAIAVDEAAGAALLAKAGLVASLSRKGASASPGGAAVGSAATAAGAADPRAVVERYFPQAYRGSAPVVEISADGVGVTWRKIQTVVGGVPSGDSGGLAGQGGPFWKQKDLKWVSASAAETPGTPVTSPQPEVLETKEFERWFPTKIRNRAPRIRMNPPKGEGDRTAFLEVGSEYVNLNQALVKKLELPPTGPERAEPRAAVSVTQFYKGRTPNRAPVIEINSPYSVVIEMKEIESPSGQAAAVASKFQSADAIVERNYPQSRRNTAPFIDISSAEQKVEISVGLVEESSKQAKEVRQSAS